MINDLLYAMNARQTTQTHAILSARIMDPSHAALANIDSLDTQAVDPKRQLAVLQMVKTLTEEVTFSVHGRAAPATFNTDDLIAAVRKEKVVHKTESLPWFFRPKSVTIGHYTLDTIKLEKNYPMNNGGHSCPIPAIDFEWHGTLEARELVRQMDALEGIADRPELTGDEHGMTIRARYQAGRYENWIAGADFERIQCRTKSVAAYQLDYLKPSIKPILAAESDMSAIIHFGTEKPLLLDLPRARTSFYLAPLTDK